ncbi:MAG TPA: methyltransferase domain-containing protein [Anaerolineae bacterium]
MNCCSAPNGLDTVFDESIAGADLREYRRRGADKNTRRIVESLAAQGIAGASVLEVGGGIGALHLELLKAGAARATAIELSPAYVDAAKTLAEQSGLGEVVEHRLMNFAERADEVAPADIVVLNRVVCCYPDMPALVRPAAQHARRLLALTFPRDTGWLRLVARLQHAWAAITRGTFRFFVHPPREIIALVKEAGLTPFAEQRTFVWQIVVFQREFD